MKDKLETTLRDSKGKKYIGGMYYYVANESEIDKVTAVTGNCNAVHSCYYSPFINSSHCETMDVTYDAERYGKIKGWAVNGVINLHRVTAVNKTTFDLGSFNKVPNRTRQVKRTWQNESRLFAYPYRYFLITDYFNPPIEVKPHEVIGNTIDVKAKAFITDKGSYNIYVDGLKGDYTGNLEGQISTASLEVPVGSTAYSQWSSTQKARDNQNYTNSLMQLQLNTQQTQFNNTFGMVQSGVGIVGNLLAGNLGGALAGGVGMYGQYKNNQFGMDRLRQEQQNAIGQRSAQMKDMSNTPRTMIQTGSDVNFKIMTGGSKVDVVTYKLTEQYFWALGDYFALYGYKQNRMRGIDINNRYYYNYIKTIGLNIKDVEGIPKAHLNKIKDIFDSGITFWHVYRSGVQMFNYDNDNYEVY